MFHFTSANDRSASDRRNDVGRAVFRLSPVSRLYSLFLSLAVYSCAVRRTRAIILFFILSCCVFLEAIASIEGRYVRLEIPPRISVFSDTKRLALYELEVYDGDSNLASQGTFAASSGHNFGLVVDGNPNSKTQTAPEANPWFEIDLGDSHDVHRLVLRPVNGERLEFGVLFSILDSDRKVVWYQRHPFIPAAFASGRPSVEVQPRAFAGRYVGRDVPRDTSAWYDLSGEEPQERHLALDHMIFPPLADSSNRRAIFEQRDSPAGLERLCRKFYAMVDPEAPGLEGFKRHYERSEYRQALDAYRDAFFGRPPARRFTLQPPLLMGVHSTFVEARTTEFRAVEPASVELLMRGQRIWGRASGLAVSDLGQPGSTRWTPPAGVPGQATPEPELNLFRLVAHQHGPHFFLYDDLLFTYAATGRTECLTRWLDYLDDWCLFGREDIFDFPENLTMASEWTTKTAGGRLRMLQEIAAKRPELVKEFRSTTFVRHLISLVEDLPPFTIRARRAELANWGCGGTEALAYLAALLPEFRCMRYFSQEAVRLAMSNYIQNRTPDGELIEAWDGGHRASDLFMMTVFDLLPHLPLPSPKADVMQMRYCRDLKNVYFRNILTDVSPEGYYRPAWLTNPPNGERASDFIAPRKYLDDYWLKLGHWGSQEPWEWLQANDPQAALRAKIILGQPCETRPGRTSDSLPYGGVFWLRDQWRDGAECLVLRNNRTRTQSVPTHRTFNSLFGAGALRYDLLKGGRSLLNAEGIVIDRKPSNPWHNSIPTGGKTEFSGMAEHDVMPDRFHTSQMFDFAEGTRRYPYSRPTTKWFHGDDWYGIWTPRPEIDNTPLTGIAAHRQVIHIRGSGLWIVADRIENPHLQRFDYAQFWTFPALVNPNGYREQVERLAKAGHPLVEEDIRRRCIRTASPGYENLSTYFFGHSFDLVQGIDQKGNYLSTTQAKSALEIIRSSNDSTQTYEHSLRKSGIRWQGEGNQALVVLHATREAITDSEKQFDNELREVEQLTGDAGVVGFWAITATGFPVWFQSGPQLQNALEAGPARARGECLLVTESDGVLRGIALGTDKTITLRGKPYATFAADFEYLIDAAGRFSSKPIHRAIGSVGISPVQNVFTDSLQVSLSLATSDTADIEIRYTLDGSDPTLQSRMFTVPFTITQDTLVKARPFRKGLTETPFNVPGELAGATVAAMFRKQAPKPAVEVAALSPGLAYEYYEGAWPILFSNIGVPGALEPKDRGTVNRLLDPDDVATIRKTEKAYAIRYSGLMKAVQAGVYSFHAPQHLLTPTMDAGFDLRVWIDGDEWYPSPTLHSQNIWHVPLEPGLHRLEVAYVDYRWKTFKDEYWMSWKPDQMWQGIPVLQVSGPGMNRQALPAVMLYHEIGENVGQPPAAEKEVGSAIASGEVTKEDHIDQQVNKPGT